MTCSKMWPRNEWALKHLNWVWVLSFLLIYVLFCIIRLLPLLVASDNNGSIAIVILMSLALGGWQWYLSVWNLKH